jgi:hypothetical protein
VKSGRKQPIRVRPRKVAASGDTAPITAGVTVWVIKHALTRGILKCNVIRVFSNGAVACSGVVGCFRPADYDVDVDAAKVKAELMRDQEIARLRRRADWLAGKKIEVVG